MSTFMPEVVDAEYRGEFRIHLVFNDGTAGEVDFTQWLFPGGPVYEPLRDLSYFRRFFVDVETIEWPNGASVAPETLYDAARAAGKSARKARGPARKRKARG